VTWNHQVHGYPNIFLLPKQQQQQQLSSSSSLSSLSLPVRQFSLSSEVVLDKEENYLKNEDNQQWVMDTFGVQRERMERYLGKNAFINAPPKHILWERANWVQDQLNLTKDDQERNRLIQKCPGLLHHSIERKLGPLFHFFRIRCTLTEREIIIVLSRSPQVLVYKLDNLRHKVTFLEESLGIDSVCKLLKRAPTLLNLKPESLQPKFDYLTDRLQLDNYDVENPQSMLTDIIIRAPSLLSMNIETKLEPTLNQIQNRLELDTHRFRNLIHRSPTMVYRTNLEDHFTWLEKVLQLKDLQELALIIERQPTILNLSIDTNLQSTIDFCIEMAGDDVPEKEVVGWFRKAPRLLVASLENRLKPRWAQIKDSVDGKLDYSTLTCMAKYTPLDWDQAMERLVHGIYKDNNNNNKKKKKKN